MSAFLKYFTVAFAASNQFTAVAGLGCEASCDGSSGQLTFEGVEDLILDGAMPVGLGNELASARKGVADLDNSLDKKADEAGDAVGDALHTKGKELTDALDLKLYSQLTGKINQNRLLIQGERQAIARHLDCGAAGFVWDDEDKSCMPLRVHTCGPLGGSPATRTVQENLYWDNRAKTEADCHGITGTECRTRCLPGWSGEEVTYTCTDSGGWKRIPSHGNRDQECYNVDECSLPDYPCPDKTYQCTDTDGSFSCGCPFSMTDFGNTCDCPNDHWRITIPETQINPQADPNQLVAYCTCPYGGETNMVPDSAGRCDCPSSPGCRTYGKELQSYPSAGLFGIENQNSNNLNYHCISLTTHAKEILIYDFNDWVNLDEVQSFDADGNLNSASGAALGSTVQTWKTHLNSKYRAELCIDGNLNTMCHSGSRSKPFIRITYACDVPMSKIRITNRGNCCQHRWKGAKIKLTDSGGNVAWTGVIAQNSNDNQDFFP